MERPDATTLRRIGALVGVLAGIAYVVLVWLGSNDIRNDLLVPRQRPVTEVEIVTIGAGRIGLARTPDTQSEGVWGIRTDDAFGVVGGVVELRSDVVVRTIDMVGGAFVIGDVAAWDPFVHRGDPVGAFGIDFESIRIAGELGPAPAWFIDGRQDTWVIVVHGRDAGFEQTLRLLPALVDAGFPVLVAGYRGDGLAPDTDSGHYGWGVQEWLEIEDAVRWTQDQGAREVALVGIGMGGSVIAQFLHESTLLPVVRGVVLDSPVLDLEATSDTNAAASGVPGFLHAPAKAVVRLRFNVEWGVLDNVARADEFDVPILVLQGESDRVAPREVAEAFAERAREGLVTLVTFAGASHEAVWNTDPTRYESTLLRFLADLSP